MLMLSSEKTGHAEICPMKKIKNPIALVLIVAMVIVSAVVFAGCAGSEPATLEGYLAGNDEAQKQIGESLAGLQSDDMRVDVSYEGNKIIITCALKSTYEGDVVQAVRDAYVHSEETMKASLEASIQEIQESTELSGITIDVVVNNGDGSELWRGSYGPVDSAD